MRLSHARTHTHTLSLSLLTHLDNQTLEDLLALLLVVGNGAEALAGLLEDALW